VQAIKRVEKGKRLLNRIKHRLYRLYARPNRYQENLEMFFHERFMEEWLHQALLLLDKYCAAWPVSTAMVPLEKLDRRKGMLAGPLFTSINYPWPTAKKRKMQPVCQVDLRDATQISGQSFGDGLLQVWLADYNDPLIRVIPRGEVESNLLTPLLPLDEYRDIEPFPIQMEWLTSESVTQIVGYGNPFFDVHWLDLITGPERFIPVSEKDRVLLVELMEFLGALKNIGGGYLFGCANGVQYSPLEKPNCFMDLADDEFAWDTGQVFYEFDQKGTPHFSFDWSCG
jgi:hypothetical protein